MTKLEQMRQRAAEILDEQAAILDEADEKHDGNLSEELEGQYQALEAELSEANATIERLEKSAKRREDLRAKQAAAGKAAPARTAATKVKAAHEDDPKHGFKTPAEFLEAVRSSAVSGRIDERLVPLAAAGSDEHSTFADPHGGFFVPEAIAPGTLQLTGEGDPLAGLVRTVPMTAPTVSFNARVDKNHSSSVSGGLRFYRRAESDTVPSSRQTFEQVKLQANELFGVAYATEEILTDSPQSFAALIAAGFQDELGNKLMKERMEGTGAGEFEGIANADCLITVAKEGAQAADTIVGANILAMRKRAWRYGSAVWMVNPDTYDQLATLHVAQTNDDAKIFTPGNGVDVPDTILGRPVIYTDYCKTLGDKGDIYLAVWSEYLQGTYQQMQSAESMHVRFLEHERTFKFYLRNDARCWWRTALTPVNSSVTRSPFVTLAERA